MKRYTIKRELASINYEGVYAEIDGNLGWHIKPSYADKYIYFAKNNIEAYERIQKIKEHNAR